jgi:hypothetical protein
MNQKITKLVRQALNECVSTPVESVIASRIDDHGIVEIPNSFAEKFAELIVKECGQWFNDRLVVEPDYGIEHRIERNRAVVGVMKEFNQHFGVEE